MDRVAVTAKRTAWFPGLVVTAGWCGLNGSDGREDDAVPECGGDGRAAWTRWR
jgi:hypothetical protein